MSLSKAQKLERIQRAKQVEKMSYNNEYNKAHYMNFSFRVNKETEMYIARQIMEQPEGVKQYLCRLVAEDIKRQRRKRVKDNDGADS